MLITVIGTGYVGLVTGVCLAETGNQVICVDIDPEKIDLLSRGIPTIYESGLEKMLQSNLAQKRLSFTTDMESGVKKSDIIILALPTPPTENGSADLSYIKKAAEQISPYINSYKIIINKSTVPVGTAEMVKNIIQPNTKFEVDVVSNPEFLREGMAIEDFMKPDRIVIGTTSPKAIELMKELYAPYIRQGNPIYFMDEKSAELTKYAANAFLATKITFMNEVANLCEKVGANIDDIRLGMGADDRIGRRFLFAGIGYGGSCFPKDVRALKHIAQENEYEFQILEAVHTVNENQKLALLPKILEHFNGNIQGKKLAVWGLAFKPNTDDIRDAPSLLLIEKLIEKGAKVIAYDPEAMANTKRKLGEKIEYAADPYLAIENADALIISTEWTIFRAPNFEKMIALLNDQLIFDGRNLYDLDKMKTLGFKYYSIGRESIL
ncbi:MAG TPA: UDP-glucose/GDP-mannose dehydrogenase family protein [Chitinophagales bacterium]|nr:UDP-glucose/GDP-mannose dehydrogenase family protein [Chitinophagales bacterium]